MKNKLIKSFTFCLIFSAVFFVSISGQNIRNPSDIQKKIDRIIQKDVSRWCGNAKLNYPPSCTLLRVFKKEGECEIWASNKNKKTMVKVTTVPVCAMDFQPGPKLCEGDGKTPEGFFTCEFHYSSNKWWMWINLIKKQIDQPGMVGIGSCFKIFIRYPTALDQCNTRTAGFSTPGGAIFLHGNCVTAGCISFKNRDFLPVFAFGRHHQSRKYGPMQIHIFPFRFDKYENQKKKEHARRFEHIQHFNQNNLLAFWKNLEQGFSLFNLQKRPLKIQHINTRVLRRGNRSPIIKDIKARLLSLKLFNGTADNHFSSDLEESIRHFQQQKGLKDDGIIGPATLKKLGILSCRYVFGLK